MKRLNLVSKFVTGLFVSGLFCVTAFANSATSYKTTFENHSDETLVVSHVYNMYSGIKDYTVASGKSVTVESQSKYDSFDVRGAIPSASYTYTGHEKGRDCSFNVKDLPTSMSVIHISIEPASAEKKQHGFKYQTACFRT